MAARTERAGAPASDAVTGTYGLEDPARALALAAGLVLTGSYVGVLVDVTDVVGGTTLLLAVVAASLLVATGMARFLRPRHAAAVGVALLAGGYAVYMTLTPYGWLLLTNLGQAFSDAVALLTGLSVLRMTGAGAWAIGFAPGPVFLSWYLFVRQRYAAGAAVGGSALAVFVLTTDAGTTVTLVGVAAAAAAVGLGEIERRAGTVEQLDTLAVLLAAMLVVGGSITLVPSGGAQPLVPGRSSATIEGGLIANSDRVSIVGSISLSAEVRFLVESDRPAYWRVGAYDRYTGQGWVRSGQSRTLSAGLGDPVGPSRRLDQEVTALAAVGAMPAAWQPVSVQGDPRPRVTSLGGLEPASSLREGDSYSVVSARPIDDPGVLRAAGTDYPDDVEERYTQLPSGTPDRVARFTAEVVGNATTPYGKAVRVERWLEANKDYSLDVRRPSGTVADSFLFEMEAGYCTYFATTMVTMLRAEGIPTRFVTGYTTGQRVAEDEYVVRALDSHAWVEVYFPDVGWVQFDPTPGGPRASAEQGELADARERGADDVDAAGSENGTWTPTPDPTSGTDDGADPGTTPTTGPGDASQVTVSGPTPAGVTPYGAGGAGRPDSGISRDLLGFGLVLLVGTAAAVRRSGVGAEAYALARIQWQGASGDPAADAERAFERLEALLARRHRERRPGETRHRYLAALADRGLDERAHRVSAVYHRARYGGGVDAAAAAEAIALVDEMVRDGTPVLRWLR